jgi:hypothetical protein
MLAETSLITNGFSARYGQAISALVNVVTRDGGQKWTGHAAYETDRPFGDGLDYGLDRAVLSGDGPVAGGVTVVGAADLSGRMDADPVNAPAPSDSRDPRHDEPWLLPHNSRPAHQPRGEGDRAAWPHQDPSPAGRAEQRTALPL